jgi:ATP-dependent exoDNAse (exonuclease V) alpha subunit
MNSILRNMTLGLMALMAGQVSAQQSRNCAPRQKVIERLAMRYGETRQSIGLGAQGAVVEVFASTDTGSWTITVTTPNGLTCLVASGQSFESMAETLPPQGNDA